MFLCVRDKYKMGDVKEFMQLMLQNQQQFLQSFMQKQQTFFAEQMQRPAVQSQSVSSFHHFDRTKETFEEYVAQMEQHFIANGVTDAGKRKSCFLSWIGSDTYHVLMKLCGETKIEDQNLDEIVKKLTEFYTSTVHVLAGRFKFLRMKMQPTDTYSTWIADLREAAKACAFKCAGCNVSYTDYAIRDMVILHTIHEPVRTAGLQKGNPTLEEVLNLATAFEQTQTAMNILKRDAESIPEVNAFNARAKYKSRSRSQSQRDRSSSRERSCPGCGSDHQRSSCKFLKAECYKCNKFGHIASVCMVGRGNSSGKSRHHSRGKQLSEHTYSLDSEEYKASDASLLELVPAQLSDGSSSADVSLDFLEIIREPMASSNQHTIFELRQIGKKMFIPIEINGSLLKFLVDTGASVSMIGKDGYNQLEQPVVNPVTTVVKAYGNVDIPVRGTLDVVAKYQNLCHNLKILVTDANGANIFGMDWFDRFGFKITKENLRTEDVFTSAIEWQGKVDSLCQKYGVIFEPNLGHCSVFKAHLVMKPDHVPKSFKARPIPFEQMSMVKKEIERLESLDVIRPVQFSQWAAPIVVVQKANKSIRICGDFKVTVNPQLLIEQYPIPRVEELFHRLQGGKQFSKIDLSDAYLQLELDDESKQLMVITTPFGLFQYQRLPFGVASAPAIFQKFIEQLTCDLPHVSSYLDDILVTGTNEDEHLKNLEEMFRRMSDANLRVNLSKCQFFKSEVEYVGHIIDAAGIRPTTKGLRGIEEMPRPKDVKELQAFIGKVNYYNRFIPNFSQMAAPLNALRKKDVSFKWSKEQEESFQQIKKHIVEASQLVHYRRDYPLVLATDASQHGIGAVLSHIYPDGSEQPIAFASKTLDKHQMRYSQVEKEALSVIFGCRKFHQYLYGRQFELITDNTGLMSIFRPNNQLPTMTANRLQRWAIFLMGYTYTMKFRPTAKHSNADALSRLPVGPDDQFDKDEDMLDINQIYTEGLDHFPIDSEKIAACTVQDKVLSKIYAFVKEGWPETTKDEQLRAFFVRKQSISVFNNVLLFQTDYTRVIVPTSLRQSVLKMLHEGHWGVVRTKQMVRRYCWWPRIDQDIEDMIKSCPSCQEMSSALPREFKNWPAAEKPWERIHLDFAGPFLNSMWMLCVDAFSRYPYVIKMNDITAQSTVRSLQGIFAIEGLPDTIVSDNGTAFTSGIFHEFCYQNGIQHLTIAPFHPASNGEAERFVRTFKGAMKKKMLEGGSTDHALLTFLSTYRFSPDLSCGKSPAEMIHGRQPKTTLSLMLPIKSRAKSEQTTKFQLQQAVFVRSFSRGPKWIRGTIIKKIGKMMYLVSTDSGDIRRHQNQMRNRIKEEEDPYSSAQRLSEQLIEKQHIFNREPTFDLPVNQRPILRRSMSDPDPVTIPRRSKRNRMPMVRFAPGV